MQETGNERDTDAAQYIVGIPLYLETVENCFQHFAFKNNFEFNCVTCTDCVKEHILKEFN